MTESWSVIAVTVVVYPSHTCLQGDHQDRYRYKTKYIIWSQVIRSMCSHTISHDYYTNKPYYNIHNIYNIAMALVCLQCVCVRATVNVKTCNIIAPSIPSVRRGAFNACGRRRTCLESFKTRQMAGRPDRVLARSSTGHPVEVI